MLNSTIIVGKIVRKVELQKTKNDRVFCQVTLAVPRNFKSLASGEYETDFINVTLWEGTAQTVHNYCGKGSVIGVRGRLMNRSYELPEFKTIRTTEIVGERVSFIQTKRPTADAPPVQQESLPLKDEELKLEVNFPELFDNEAEAEAEVSMAMAEDVHQETNEETLQDVAV